MSVSDIPAITTAENAPGASAAKVWQHLVLEIYVPEEDGWAQAIQNRLDEIASQGWELVSMTSMVLHFPAPSGMAELNARDTLIATFKRFVDA